MTKTKLLQFVVIALLNTLAWSQQIPANSAPYGIDVSTKGAKGDATFANDLSAASGSATVTSFAPRFVASDVNKTLMIDTSSTPQPVLVGVIATSGANCAGSVGIIDTTLAATIVYYRISYVKTAVEGTNVSYEGWVNVPIGAANNCVIVTHPATSVTINGSSVSMDSWKIYASIEPYNPWQANHAYALGDQIVDVDGYVQTVTVAGTSAGSVPAFNRDLNGTRVDNTVTWTNQGSYYPGRASGTETLQNTECSSGNPAITSDCELDTITTTGAAVPAPTRLTGKILTFNSTTSVTLTSATPATFPNAVAGNIAIWGTDNQTILQNAITNMAAGNKLYFPPGSYLVGCPGLTMTGTAGFYGLEGAGVSGSKITAPGPPVSAGLSELVAAGNCTLLTVGVNGSTNTAGPLIRNLGFRDGLQGGMTGAIQLFGMAHTRLENIATNDFRTGFGVSCSAGAVSAYCQYNKISDHVSIATKNAIVFTGGRSLGNWIIGGHYSGPQIGGGICIDFQRNSANAAGGSNRILSTQCSAFPLMYHAYDNTNTIFDDVRGENNSTKQPQIAGSAGFGAGVLLEGNYGAGFCVTNRVTAGSMNSLGMLYRYNIGCPTTFVTLNADAAVVCASAVAPAVCGSAPSGSVALPAASTSMTVNTSAVTAISQIFVKFDESLGTRLGVTCNTAAGSEAADYIISGRVVGIGFTIKATAAPVTNPACLSYNVVN